MKFISLPQLALLLYYQLSQIVNNFFYFFSKNLELYFFTILLEKKKTRAFLKHALETEIFILGPYLQKAENNLASKVLSKMRIDVILSL